MLLLLYLALLWPHDHSRLAEDWLLLLLLLLAIEHVEQLMLVIRLLLVLLLIEMVGRDCWLVSGGCVDYIETRMMIYGHGQKVLLLLLVAVDELLLVHLHLVKLLPLLLLLLLIQVLGPVCANY